MTVPHVYLETRKAYSKRTHLASVVVNLVVKEHHRPVVRHVQAVADARVRGHAQCLEIQKVNKCLKAFDIAISDICCQK